MEIRHTRPEDLTQLLALYQTARSFMREQGNHTQWPDSYPSEALVREDIAKGLSYVCCEGSDLLAVFTFESNVHDPTYRKIRDGAWPNNEPYGVIHRIAVGQPGRDIAGFCFDWCAARCEWLRADTHADNLPMQKALEKNGFTRCGIIQTYDGTDRIAYSRPSAVWLAQDEPRRRKLYAVCTGLYALACILVAALLFDLLRATGSVVLLIPLLVIMALPGTLSIATRLRSGGGIGIDHAGIDNRLVDRTLHGVYGWEHFTGAAFDRQEHTLALALRDPDAFFDTLPKRARKSLRRQRIKNKNLPLSCLLLSKADRKRLLRLCRIYLAKK